MSKHVQTELTPDEYDRFREFVREGDLSVKEAVHEALLEWDERQERPDPSDPAFTVLEQLDRVSFPDTAETDASEEEDLVEEWEAAATGFVLTEDPPIQR